MSDDEVLTNETPAQETQTDPEPEAHFLTKLEEQIAAALLAINTNTFTSYPQAVWDGSAELSWPITVYTLDSSTVETRNRAEARVRITLHVDTFGRSRAEAAQTAEAIRDGMLGIFTSCTQDRVYDNPTKGIVRRVQSFTGILHVYDGIVYNS